MSRSTSHALSRPPGPPHAMGVRGSAPARPRPAAAPKSKVLIYSCRDYGSARIAEIIGEGMRALGVRPQGRTMVKPNAVIAHPQYFRHAFTRPEFLDGLLAALRANGPGITDLSVGERSGLAIPTRFSFAEAGYGPVLRRHGARAVYFDETRQVEVPLHHPDALRASVFLPEPLLRLDFFVNAPKLKSHPRTRFTAALKNAVGVEDDGPRLLDQRRLHRKIADLQEIIPPGLVAVDAIVAGQGSTLAPEPRPLNLIILGTNPVAVDIVCARLFGVDPRAHDALRMCFERGLGPMDMDEVDLGGNLSLADAQHRAIGLRMVPGKVDKQFDRDSHIQAFSGTPGDPLAGPHCSGGCPGILFDTTEILRLLQPGLYGTARPMNVVFGDGLGGVPETSPARLVFVGDCAQGRRTVNGREVNVPSVYRDQDWSRHKPLRLYLLSRLFRVVLAVWRGRGQPAVVLRGCPVSLPEAMLAVALIGGVKNPFLGPGLGPRFILHHIASRLVRTAREAGIP